MVPALRAQRPEYDANILGFVLLALVPFLVLLFGTVLGLWWATRLALEAGWKRWLVLALGWIFLPSILCAGFAVIAGLMLGLLGPGKVDAAWQAIEWSAMAFLPVLAGIFVHRKAIQSQSSVAISHSHQ